MAETQSTDKCIGSMEGEKGKGKAREQSHIATGGSTSIGTGYEVRHFLCPSLVVVTSVTWL